MNSILEQDIMYLPGVGPKRKKILSTELGINNFGDLLEYYPYKYVDRSRIYSTRELTPDMPFVQLKGKILSYETFDMGPRKQRLVGHFSDGVGVIDLVWFSGVRWVTENYKVGKEYIIFGKPTIFNSRYQISHPDIDDASTLELNDMGMQPYYITTEKMKKAGITSRTMERIMKTLLSKLPPLSETLPDFIIKSRHLVSRDEAIRRVHYPHNQYEMQHARERMKFEELFYVQLNILRYTQNNRRKYKGYLLPKVGKAFKDFYDRNLPFDLTGAQKRVMHEIQRDMNTGRQMNRLVQGDVGSGKTLVALMAMLIAIDNGFQAVMMAPTEILAEQHLATIKEFLKGLDVRVELLTGIVKGKKRKEVMEGLISGDVKILIGTHAVIEDNVQFRSLGLVIIDEQHRFGVAQRAKLQDRPSPPHVLVMTATPIPRTLAMTVYGDLDVSVIDELPPGRKPVRTIHIYDNQPEQLHRGVVREVEAGHQVYFVFPLVKESEKLDLRNVEDEYVHLREVFPHYDIGMVHGKMKPSEKDAVMQRFVQGKTQILVATTVIEVGVNVPNASVMVIESAERFGLAQLHQLRGRVGRGAEKSYCILVTGYKLSKESRQRIDMMCATNDGFELAEADLKMRGPGDFEGTRQSGLALELHIADLAKDSPILEDARNTAMDILSLDPALEDKRNALLAENLKNIRTEVTDYSKIS